MHIYISIHTYIYIHTYIQIIGPEGDSKVAMTQPYGVAIGESGRIFVANQEEQDRNVLVLSPMAIQSSQVGFA
jgi:hypothetical protein